MLKRRALPILILALFISACNSSKVKEQTNPNPHADYPVYDLQEQIEFADLIAVIEVKAEGQAKKMRSITLKTMMARKKKGIFHPS